VSSAEISAEATPSSTSTAEVTQPSTAPTSQDATTEASTAEAAQDSDDVFSDASFLSFEDWKKQIAEKMEAEQESGKGHEKRRRPEDGSPTLDAIGDDHEIDIDFGAFLSNGRDKKAPETPDASAVTASNEHRSKQADPANKMRHLGKDAGKTCKERTNFASFDSGAQVMKTNKEAKSASLLLNENRDAYMLNPCGAKNKFVIVELSDSILVETVGLANFEFFSSTFRQFRISVSDRYPVKEEKWVDLGTFEARNSREIQAFLVEDPRVWARYLRIEFLNQYGNEFYCPVSLLRVHGRTMIQDILSMEQPAGEDEEADEILETAEGSSDAEIAPSIIETVVEVVASGIKPEDAAVEGNATQARFTSVYVDQQLLGELLEAEQRAIDPAASMPTSPWTEPLAELDPLMCPLSPSKIWQSLQGLISSTEFRPAQMNSTVAPHQPTPSPQPITQNTPTSTSADIPPTVSSSQPTASASLTATTPVPSIPVTTSAPSVSSIPVTEQHKASSNSSSGSAPSVAVPASLSTSSSSAPSPPSSSVTAVQSSTSQASRTQPSSSSVSRASSSSGSSGSVARPSATASAHSPHPSTQESFFKTVNKRLQMLEQNSTLSLQYIEEQSRHLREAFNKVEKRQLTKTTAFLETLNATIFDELRQFGEQYDQIWQSTVIELESQRDLLSRETQAMSSRLKLLADELVFQKRMAIIQSVLLLLCLGLVLFSRFLPGTIEVHAPAPADLASEDELRELNGRGHDSHVRQRLGKEVFSSMSSPRSDDSNMSPERYMRGASPPGAYQDDYEHHRVPVPIIKYEDTNADTLYEPQGYDEEHRRGFTPEPTPEPPSEFGLSRLMEQAVQTELLPAFRDEAHRSSQHRHEAGDEQPATPPEIHNRGELGAINIYAHREGSRATSPRTRKRISNIHQQTDGAVSDVQNSPKSPTSPTSPTSDTEGGRPRGFSIARKPLPALPREET
jgi:hypothetical protein